jgi:hypothetical protein
MHGVKESARHDSSAPGTRESPRAARSPVGEGPQPARSPGPSPAQAVQLQRAAGNRAATRALARWSKHPDEKQKGKLVTDGAAADYVHFNFPLSK